MRRRQSRTWLASEPRGIAQTRFRSAPSINLRRDCYHCAGLKARSERLESREQASSKLAVSGDRPRKAATLHGIEHLAEHVVVRVEVDPGVPEKEIELAIDQPKSASPLLNDDDQPSDQSDGGDDCEHDPSEDEGGLRFIMQIPC